MTSYQRIQNPVPIRKHKMITHPQKIIPKSISRRIKIKIKLQLIKTDFIKMTKDLTNLSINPIQKIETSIAKKTMIITTIGTTGIDIKNLTTSLTEL